MKDAIIEKINNLSATPETSESDVDHLMTLIRKLQEREGKTNKYPLLDFFCDWTKHTTLSRTPAQRIVIELNEVLFRLRNSADIINGISNIISFERLQVELKSFFTDYGLLTDIVTQKKLWLRYVVHLLHIISDCALELPINSQKNVKNKIKEGLVAVSMKYTFSDKRIFVQSSTDEKVWSLVITLSDTTTLIFPCKVLGLYLAFTKPD